MKKILALLLLFVPLSLHAQQQGLVVQGTISASTTNCTISFSCVWENVLPSNAATTTINISGTFSETLLVEESNNGGQTWATAATLSAIGTTTYSTNSFTDIRVRCSAFVSGLAVVTISTGLNTGLQGSPGTGGGSSSVTVFYASSKAVLNTNLQSGGGTNDTAVLQNILKPGGSCVNVPKGGIQLIMDGPALVSGLLVCSNESIVCQPAGIQPAINSTNVGGFYLANNSNVPVLMADSQSGSSIVSSNISISSCFMNGNKANNTLQQANLAFNPCMEFYGTASFVILNNMALNCPYTGISLSGTNIYEQNNRFESVPNSSLNTGGTDLRGNTVAGGTNNVRILNETVCAGDDGIALNSRLYAGSPAGPNVQGGNINTVMIDGMNMDCPVGGTANFAGIDLVSDGSFLVDNVSILHVRGNVSNLAIYINRDACTGGILANGWFGDIYVEDVDVTAVGPPFGGCVPGGLYPVDASISSLRMMSIRNSGTPDPILPNFTANAYVGFFQSDFVKGNVAAGVFTQTSPSAIAADSFHWPNGNTLPPPWVQYNGNSQTLPSGFINSSQYQHQSTPINTHNDMIYGNAPLVSGTQFSEITIPTSTQDANTAEEALFRVQVPLTQPQSSSSVFNHYECQAFNGNIILNRWVANVKTSLQTTAQAVVAGDKVQGYANGTTIQCIYTPVSTGIPAIIDSQVDASFSTGTVGIGVFDNGSGAISKWTGGAIIPTLSSGPFITSQARPCTNTEIALSAGWQSTGSATVTAVAGAGQTCSWTITTGTTTAANPTVTDTLLQPLPNATTVCELIIHGGTHTGLAGEDFNQTAFSATAPVFTANFTPTAGGTTYFVTRRCGP